MAETFAPADPVWARFGVGETLAWYQGTVEAVRDVGPTGWERYLVAWSVARLCKLAARPSAARPSAQGT